MPPWDNGTPTDWKSVPFTRAPGSIPGGGVSSSMAWKAEPFTW